MSKVTLAVIVLFVSFAVTGCGKNKINAKTTGASAASAAHPSVAEVTVASVPTKPYLASKRPVTKNDITTPIKLETANYLVLPYAENPIAADAKFKGKTVTFMMSIKEISTAGSFASTLEKFRT